MACAQVMVFVELSSFTKKVVKLPDDESYADLQMEIAVRPDEGSLIPKGGGLRKIRWRAKGKGKTGGVRIIYFWRVSEDQVLVLDIYPKNKKENLSGDELKELKKKMEEWVNENKK